MTVKTIAIVGNAPPQENCGTKIDACNIVVRFNEPAGYGDYYGKRCDYWCLTNSGKAPKRWLKRGYSAEFSSLLSSHPQIVFPLDSEILAKYHVKPNFFQQLRGQCLDYSVQMSRHFCDGKPPFTLPSELYLEACRRLEIDKQEMRQYFPSSGFLMALWLRERYPKADLNLFGFSFSGWKRHKWEIEKNEIGAIADTNCS